MRVSWLLMLAAVIGVGVGTLSAAATTPCLTVTPSNPTTVLTWRTHYDGGVLCQGYTDKSVFGYVSGGVSPYSVSVSFDPDPPFYVGSAGIYSAIVEPDGHIKLVSPFDHGVPTLSAKHESTTYAVSVTVTDSVGNEQQISDVWTVTGACDGGPWT
jgi:hypothetical protein